MRPLVVYLVEDDAETIRSLASREGVGVSLYLRQRLKRLLPLDVGYANIKEDGRKGD